MSAHEEPRRYVMALVIELEPLPGETIDDAWERVTSCPVVLVPPITPATATQVCDPLYGTGPLPCPAGDLEWPRHFDVDVWAEGKRLRLESGS